MAESGRGSGARVPELDEAALEAALRDLAARVAYPPTPALAARVRARISARALREEAPARGTAAPRRLPWVFAFAPAIVTLIVLGAGAAALELVRLRGAEVFRVPSITAPALRPLDLGERVSLAEARRLGAAVPTDPLLAQPDEVYLRGTPTALQVHFAYRPRPGLPAGPTGYGALVGQFAGELDVALIGKGVGPGARIEEVSVRGARGVWIEGETHFFFYRDSAGDVVQESLRLAGNTLLWERDGRLLRLEAQVGQAEALRLAASIP